MKRRTCMRGSLIATFILIGFGCRSQELSYKQFTVKDGLPGSIVYQCLQDNNGFIWFATNQGVSRFDGRTFKNFSKEDGLPDNDILKLYLDKYNNVWFISLLGIPSVFHNNSIIRFDSCQNVRAICEDGLSDSIQLMMFNTGKSICGYYTSVNEQGRWSFTLRIRPTRHPDQFPVLRASSQQNINVYFSSSDDSTQQLSLKDKNTEKQYSVSVRTSRSWFAFGWQQRCCISNDWKGVFYVSPKTLYYADVHRISQVLDIQELGLNETIKDDINQLFSENDSTLWICSRSQGLQCIQNVRSPHPIIHSYFPKSFCTSIIKDKESGYWITTHSDGVYYLPNLAFHSLSAMPDLAIKSVKCIRSLDSTHVAAGFSDGNIMVIDNSRLDSRLLPYWAVRNRNNRVMDIRPFGRHSMLVGTDVGLYRVFEKKVEKIPLTTLSVKELYVPSDSSIIVATSFGIIESRISGQSRNLSLSLRATCVSGLQKGFYWGTMQGLYAFRGDSQVNMGIKYPPLSGVINHIDIAPDSSVWVSTDNGIVVLQEDRLMQITKDQGLVSNLCKHISFDDHTCWVSTDKGISRISYNWGQGHLTYALSNITEEDGLTSNDVNQTIPSGAYIWAATARGISFFSKAYISHSVWQPLINITRIVADDTTLALNDTISLGHKKTRLLIELSGISFRSGKELGYEYREKGQDSNWRRVTNNSIEFPALPFGDYALEVRAIDRWGKRSGHSRTVFIHHPPPFWLATWFILSSYLLMALLAGACVYLYHRVRRRKREKDYQLKKKMQDLEMMALRAQMNPHFIFNCLTSIQYHIMHADARSANNYLHKFSTLIRKTLQNSANPMSALRDEVHLLKLYLDLEKLRLGERMDYKVDLSPEELEPGNQLIPSMIVQPYVENAIKHGIGPLENTRGLVQVTFRSSGGRIECTIEDNGPGIDASRRDNASDPGYRSMGTSITERRIHTINALQKEKIQLSVTDKRTSGSSTNGTIVQLFFPFTSN